MGSHVLESSLIMIAIRSEQFQVIHNTEDDELNQISVITIWNCSSLHNKIVRNVLYD